MEPKPSYKDLEQKLAINSKTSVPQRRQDPKGERAANYLLPDERFRSLVENINEIVFSTDTKANVTYVGPNIVSFSGYTQEEIIGKNFIEFVHPDDLSSRLDQFQKIMDGENLVTEYRMLGKNGRIIWVRANARRVDSDACFAGLQGILVDITDRKIMEENLRQSEERYRNLFHNAQVGLVRTTIEDGVILEANELCAQMFQYSREEVLGMQSSYFYHNPEDRIPMRDKLKNQGFINNHEVQMRRKDGSVFWASYSLRIYPENGCLEGAIIDISKRKSAEEALTESEERFKALIAQSPISYEYYAMDGTLLENNNAHCRMWDVQRENVVGKYNVFKDPSVMGKPKIRKFVERAFAGEVVQVPPFVLRPTSKIKKAKKTLWLKTTLYPIKRQGEVVNVVIVQEDVTDQKQMEAKLEETHKKLLAAAREAGMAEVATGVLHNVGNILNSVHVTASSIREKMDKSRIANLERAGAMLRDHMETIDDYLTKDPKGKKLPPYLAELASHITRERRKLLDDTKQLAEYIDHIVSIISLQQSFGKIAGLTEILDIEEVVEAAVSIHKTALTRHGILLERDYQDLPSILADRNRIMQILVNLMANAKHAIKSANTQNGIIKVSLKTDSKDWVFISVADNGIGVPMENLDKIFTHGFTTRKKGHGFGLHSGSLAASEMGGNLSVHSEGKGKGALFTLSIPYKLPENKKE